jgi:2-succinyl-6-hydroxy-2,4-cyclohexadiene-1-carboxylate synthase
VHAVLAGAPEHFTLCGYSLGGRVALHVALAAPERVSRLVLVSCSAGIEDPLERAVRREADGQLAQDLEGEPFEQFIERWRTQPLFASEPPAVGQLARADQRRNHPHALAAVLRGLGAGAMEPLWGRLSELHMPVTVIAGERDAKYVSIGQQMVAGISDARLLVIDGGHGLPLENPAAIAQALA